MSELVETPEGKGRLSAIAEVVGGWRVHVELVDGGTWTGSASELLGAEDQKALEAFRRRLGEDRRGPT